MSHARIPTLRRDSLTVRRAVHDELCVVTIAFEGAAPAVLKQSFARCLAAVAAQDLDHPLVHALGAISEHHVQVFASGSQPQLDLWLGEDAHFAMVEQAFARACEAGPASTAA